MAFLEALGTTCRTWSVSFERWSWPAEHDVLIMHERVLRSRQLAMELAGYCFAQGADGPASPRSSRCGKTEPTFAASIFSAITMLPVPQQSARFHEATGYFPAIPPVELWRLLAQRPYAFGGDEEPGLAGVNETVGSVVIRAVVRE